MWELELRNFLKSGMNFQNIHWQTAPEGAAYPLVIMNLISTTPEHTQDGLAGNAKIIVQVDIWGSESFLETVQMKNDLVNSVDDFLPTDKIAHIWVNQIRSAIDTSAPKKLHRQSVDLNLLADIS